MAISSGKTLHNLHKKYGNSAAFIFIFLGALTAFGPFVTDMYLPALPQMADFFNANISMVQMGLTSSMLGLALGQLFFGPLSDKHGRRLPLVYSLALFAVSTSLCIIAPNIEIFVILRFIQGIAASGGIVIARSVAADKFKKQSLSKALAIIGAINGIAPIAAPVIGGVMLRFIGWRGIFAILLAIGCALWGFCLKFRETLSKERRIKTGLADALKHIPAVLKNKTFLFYTLELSFALAVMFAYIASSPFIIQNHYGYSAFAFSLFFAANAVGIGAGAASAVKFKSEDTCLKVSSAGILIFCILLSTSMALNAPIAVYECSLFCLCLTLGMTFTASTSRAMNAERSRAGTASAVMGSTGFLFGSIVSPLAGIGNIMLSSSIVMTTLAVLTALSCAKALKLK